MRVTIAGDTYVSPRLTERIAVTISDGSVPRPRNPSAPARRARLNGSVPPRHSSARIRVSGEATRTRSMTSKAHDTGAAKGRHSAITTSAGVRARASER